MAEQGETMTQLMDAAYLEVAQNEAKRWQKQSEKAEEEVGQLRVKQDGAERRAKMLLEAKNRWADRALAAEVALGVLEEVRR